MERTDLGRIVGFTDGVMAVAITLLVLNIEVPRRAAANSTSLVDLIPHPGRYLLVLRAGRTLLGDSPPPVRDPSQVRRHADGAEPGLPRRDRDRAVRHRSVRQVHRRAARHCRLRLHIGLAALTHWRMHAHTAAQRASCTRTTRTGTRPSAARSRSASRCLPAFRASGLRQRPPGAVCCGSRRSCCATRCAG